MCQPCFTRFLLSLLTLFAFATALAETENDFELPDLNGKLHHLSDYKGKWVLVNYWATWCPPCLEEIPELEIFHNNHAESGDAVVLGVDFEDIDLKRLKAFVEEQFISYPILVGGTSEKAVLHPIPGLPTSLLYSPEGELVAKQTGPVTAEGISDFIKNYVPDAK